MEKKILHSVEENYAVQFVTNEISEFLNSILNDEQKRLAAKFKQGHYFLVDRRKNRWGFRYPGATRGQIIIDDNNIITGIEFYGADCPAVFDIYDDKRKEEFNQFIGWEVDYPYHNPQEEKENA